MEGFDPSKLLVHIIDLNANKLYGLVMCFPLPIHGFKWKEEMPSLEEIITKAEDAKRGWILKVDLEYPSELHNTYPLPLEKRSMKEK